MKNVCLWRKGLFGDKKVSLQMRKFGALALIMVVFLHLVACGKDDIKESLDDMQQGEWGYVPRFLTIDVDNVSYNDLKLFGENLYCFSKSKEEETGEGEWILYRYSLDEESQSSLSLDWKDAEEGGYISQFTVAEDGTIYLIYEVFSASDQGGSYETKIKDILYQFNESGELIFSQDISQYNQGYSFFMQTDTEGNLYLATGNTVLRFDAEGNVSGSVSVGTDVSSIYGMGYNKEGKLYAAYCDVSVMGGFILMNAMDYTLVEINFDSQKEEKDGHSLSNYEVNTLSPGIEKDFLLYNTNAVYEYDFLAETITPLFTWLDCDINGAYAKALGALEDGRIVVAYRDSLESDDGIALLTKTWLTPDSAKQTIVLGTISNSSSLQDLVVKFNKSNSKWRIEIQSYYNSASGETWADARTNLCNAFITDNCPDLIDLSGLDVATLALSGVFEDLNPYLEKSSILNREDILESILNAYTIDGALTAIPYRFSVQTVAGSASELSEIGDWTIEKVIAYAQTHPEAELFNLARKSKIMEYLLLFNESAFIDWSTGECNFASEGFINLLQFVNQFPDTLSIGADVPAEPVRIQNGEVLLTTDFMTSLSSVQVYKEMYQGDVTYVGYPTMDGGNGHRITSASQIFAVASKSTVKEGAWEFIESVLTQGKTSFPQLGFPSLKDKLEEEVAEVLQGESDQGSYWSDGWIYTYRTPTQEEVDMVLNVLNEARLVSEGNEEILAIINEEAEAFYQGQKTVEEVADIIQSRVSLYVSEKNF